MKEEKVTINLLNWLELNGWSIVSFDFPQSGTGVMLHPNSIEKRSNKNKLGIIPDIIAARNSIAVLFENKDRFVFSDFNKLKEIKESDNYSSALNTLLQNFKVSKIFYGIGIPSDKKQLDKSLENIEGLDFLISTNNQQEVIVHFDRFNVFP